MNLILLQPEDFPEGGERAVLRDERAAHIIGVLGAGPGKRLRIGLPDGPLGEGEVVAVRPPEVVLACSFSGSAPPRPPFDLVLAMPRPKVMKRLWSRLAELGTDRIFIVNAARVEKYYFASHVLEPAFVRRRLIEGLQQAVCTRLPEVFVRPRFRPFVEDEVPERFTGSLKLLADPAAETRIGEVVREADPLPRRAVIAVGPEGGWTDFERALWREQGFRPVSLGRRVLRTDTACTALLAVLRDRMEERWSDEKVD